MPLRKLVAETERRLQDARQGRNLDYELFEQRLSERLAEVEITRHATTLAALDVDAAHVMLNEKLHARVDRNPGDYKSQAGPVAVPRSLYRPVGERNAPTVDLVTLRSGAIADGWLPGTVRAMAHLLQQGTSREAEQTAKRILTTFPFERGRSSTTQTPCRDRPCLPSPPPPPVRRRG